MAVRAVASDGQLAEKDQQIDFAEGATRCAIRMRRRRLIYRGQGYYSEASWELRTQEEVVAEVEASKVI